MGHSNLLEKPGRLMLAKKDQQAYHWVQNNGRSYLQLPSLSHPGVFHLFGTRLLDDEALAHYKPIRLQQVHGTHVQPVPKAPLSALLHAIEGDALVTDVPNRFISVGTADCVPVLLVDPVKGVSAAIHAGWRGSVQNIVGKTVQKMVSLYGATPANIFAGIGPSIQPCCFEVSADVVEAVEKQTPHSQAVLYQEIEKRASGKWQLDLITLNRLQLIDAGLPETHVASAGLCTSCLPNLFYSFRRDKKKRGNMVSGIMLI